MSLNPAAKLRRVSGSDAADRLEQLWAGEFGDEYVDRNIRAEEGRRDFWRAQLEKLGVRSALEIGCNVGGNLRWIADVLGTPNVSGIDINERALEILRERVPGIDVRVAAARELPFDDASFELTFTMGVLIHQPQEHLDEVMSEIVRTSSRYVLCGEYYADELTEVPYRGQEGALFKLDYGARYQELFPDLKLIDTGFLPRSEGVWDDVTYWVFEKPR
jgi:pseudaminic acid biosynthesis-associated methylase